MEKYIYESLHTIIVVIRMFVRRRGFRKDEKGVSPIIGTILLVAITVVLAAVIGTFVFGLGTRVKAAPKAQLMLDEAEDQIDDMDGNDTILYISHVSGDSLRCSDIKWIVKDLTNSRTWVLVWDQQNKTFHQLGTNGWSSNSPVIIANASFTASGNPPAWNCSTNASSYNVKTDGMIQIGDTLVLVEGNVNPYTGIAKAGSPSDKDIWNYNNVPAEIEITCVHIPTNAIIYKGTQMVQ